MLLDRQCFLDQHDRNVMTDRVENLAIGPNQSVVHLFGNEPPRSIAKRPGSDLLIEPLQELRISERHWLVCLRAAEKFQELEIDHCHFAVGCFTALRP